MRTLIIFEGVDNTGKTTLAKALKSKLENKYSVDFFRNPEGEIRKMCKSENNLLSSERQLWQTIACLSEMPFQMGEAKSDFVILDRCFLSNFAYSRALCNETYLNEIDLMQESMLKPFKHFLNKNFDRIFTFILTNKQYKKESDFYKQLDAEILEHCYKQMPSIKKYEFMNIELFINDDLEKSVNKILEKIDE